MDVNTVQRLGLEELFEEDDSLFAVEDILDSVTLPPMHNPWGRPPIPEQPAAAARRRRGIPGALALTLNILIYAVCAAVIAGSLMIRFSKDNGSAFGYHIYHVVSGSMTPAADGSSPPGGFYAKDAIVVKNAAPETVREGDVVTFWQDDSRRGMPNTHRVMGIEILSDRSILFTTKGDANAQEDPEPVPGSRLIGVKVLRIPKLGGPLKWADDHPWITVGISAGVMAVVLAMYIVTVKRSGKKEEE